MTCSLCSIPKREKYRLIYEDDFVFVAMNYEPIKDGHIMILPKRHAENLSDLTADEALAFLRVADRCMRALSKLHDDFGLLCVNGHNNRSQKHLHAHIVPSKHAIRDLFALADKTPNRKRASKAALARMTKKLKPFFSS